MDKQHTKLISGSSNLEFARKVAKALGLKLTPVTISRFADDETFVRIEESVRGCNIFIIQSTCSPTNDNLMELLVMVDALKRGSAHEITAVMPYYGYSRQDRKTRPREPITARLVADMLEAAGVHRVVTFDLHVEQIQGFFSIPSDNLEAMPMLASHFLNKRIKNTVVVSPDVGGAKRARRFAKLLGASIAIIDKRRSSPNSAEVMNIVGDVKGKDAIIIDDMIDTAASLCKAAKAVRKAGAKSVCACATHALLSADAKYNLSAVAIDEIVVTDTIPIPAEKMLRNIRIISLAPLLAQSIKRICEGQPMGIMFDKIYSRLQKKRK